MNAVGRGALVPQFISNDELLLIRYQLGLAANPSAIKAGLQRLCGHLESDRFLSDVGPIRNIVRGLAFNENIMVRRWSYKVMAHIGSKDDISTLSERLRNETDLENLTWIMAAIFSLSTDTTVLELCRDNGIEFSDSMALSALLFGKNAIDRLGTDIPQINIEKADGLTLKWCALLAGYGKAPPNILHPRYENKALLGALNKHHEPEVSEYSIWAFWNAPEFSIDDLQIGLNNILKQPENVRRWTNRLMAKSPVFLMENLDFFEELTDAEGVKAREGLALGIRDVHFPEFEKPILRWYGNESDSNLRELLLEHLALSESRNTRLFEILRQAYNRAEHGGSIRTRLRAAVSQHGGKLLRAFNQIDLVQQAMIDSPSLFDETGSTSGVFALNDNRTFIGGIHAGGDVTAQNVAGGDLVAAANASVQNLRTKDANIAEVLDEILALLKQPDAFSSEQANLVIEAVNDVALEPTPANKGKLLGVLTTMAGVVNIGSAATKLPDLIEKVTSFL